jgi:NTP pyrophosphatase (non-canonical NTP hydrolase)
MEELFALKIAKDGTESQIRQAQEECAELITALSHFCRGRRGARDEVAEEMADVEILLLQLRKIFENDKAVTSWKQKKLSKLALEFGVTYESE